MWPVTGELFDELGAVDCATETDGEAAVMGW